MERLKALVFAALAMLAAPLYPSSLAQTGCILEPYAPYGVTLTPAPAPGLRRPHDIVGGRLVERPVPERAGPDSTSVEIGAHRPTVHPSQRVLRPFDEIVKGCKALYDRIVWVDGKGTEQRMHEWRNDQRWRISQIFAKLWSESVDLGLKCVIPAKAYCKPGQCSREDTPFITAEQTFDIFAAHVAHVVYMEMKRKVPWSLVSAGGELDEVLHAGRYFTHMVKWAGYGQGIDGNGVRFLPPAIEPGRDYTKLYEASDDNNLVCDPRDGYRFLSANGLIGNTEQETLERLSFWFQENVAHTTRDSGPAVPEHLRSVANANTLSKRLGPQGSDNDIPAGGCHGAADLFRDLARSVNIPLLRTRMPQPERQKNILAGLFNLSGSSHAGLCWRWTRPNARCLIHLDDISANMRGPFRPPQGASIVSDPASLRKLFFAELWQTPDYLKKSGFRFDIRKVTRGSAYGKPNQGQEHYPDYGYLVGDWMYSDRGRVADRNARLVTDNSGFQRYEMDKSLGDLWDRRNASYHFALVPQDGYLSLYCDKIEAWVYNNERACYQRADERYEAEKEGIETRFSDCLKKAGGDHDQEVACRGDRDRDVVQAGSRRRGDVRQCLATLQSKEDIIKSNDYGAVKDIPHFIALGDQTKSSQLDHSHQPSQNDVQTRLNIIAQITGCKL